MALRPWDRQEVHTLFDGLEFRVLRERLFETLESVEDVDGSGFDLDGAELAAGDVAAWLEEAGTDRIGVLVRGSWGAGTGQVDAIALATGDGRAAYVDTTALGPDDDAALAAWLADAARPKVLHDAKGPALALAAHGWTLAGVVSDTALAAYLVRPDQRSYDLADLTVRYLKRELKQEEVADQEALFDDGGEVPATAMLQARAVLDLAEALDDGDRGARRHPPAGRGRAAAGRAC